MIVFGCRALLFHFSLLDELGSTNEGIGDIVAVKNELITDVKAHLDFLIEKLKDDLYKDIATEGEYHQAKIRKVSAEVEEINKNITREHQEVRKLLKDEQAQRKGLEMKHQKWIKALESKHESEMKAVESKHQTEMKALGNKHEAQMEVLENKYQRQMKVSDKRYFVLLIMIISINVFVNTFLIAWCITETSWYNKQNMEGVKTVDIIGQSTVKTKELYDTATQKILNTFHSKMHNIQSNFPGEVDRFWSSILAPISRIIREVNPYRPAVILIATRRSCGAIAECLSREVALLLDNLYGLDGDDSDTYITLEAVHLNSLGPGDAKSQMDQALSDNYRRRHMVAVIHDLGSLPPTAATLLHAYCDHESAHFKKVVLLATVYLEPGITLCTKEVEVHLSEVWQELEEDVLKPLISRVANNIAIMETRDIANHKCVTWLWHISPANWNPTDDALWVRVTNE